MMGVDVWKLSESGCVAVVTKTAGISWQKIVIMLLTVMIMHYEKITSCLARDFRSQTTQTLARSVPDLEFDGVIIQSDSLRQKSGCKCRTSSTVF